LIERSIQAGVKLSSISVKPTTLDDVVAHDTGHGSQEGRG